MGKFVYFYAIFAHFCQFQTKFSQNFALRAIFVTFWLNFCGQPRSATEKAAKNRAKIRIWDFGGWGINKKFWPEYSPLLKIENSQKKCEICPTKKLTETELMVYNKFEVSSFRKDKHFYEIQTLLADKLELVMEFENIYTSKTLILGHFWAHYQNFKYVLTI